MLGCRFSFEAHGKNLREKATKRSFKTTEILLDADIYFIGFVDTMFDRY